MGRNFSGYVWIPTNTKLLEGNQRTELGGYRAVDEVVLETKGLK